MPERNAGQDFIRLIRPLGAAAFLLIFVLSTAIMFMSARDPLKSYTPPMNSQYYLSGGRAIYELQTELEENVFPLLDGDMDCAVSDGKLIIRINRSGFYKARAAILRHYDPGLFEFVMK